MLRYKYPAAVVFDLDYTLWPWWCDCHISSPVRSINGSQLADSSGLSLKLYDDISSIIKELHKKGVVMIGASRTATPEIATEILNLFEIGGKPMIQYFDALQWGQHSKIKHIQRASVELGLEKELEEGSFILFDDESRNGDVSSINCHFALIDDCDKGLTREVFEQAMTRWSHSTL